jgi:hypothetical protein
LRGLADAGDFFGRLVHQTRVEDGGTVFESGHVFDECERNERERRRRDADLAARFDVGRNIASDLLAEFYLDAARFRRRAIDFGRAVEIERARARGRQDGQAVALEDREIACVHEVIALPAVAVGNENVDARGGHRIGKLRAARSRQCGGFQD